MNEVFFMLLYVNITLWRRRVNSVRTHKKRKVYSNVSFLVSSVFFPGHINYRQSYLLIFFLMETLFKQCDPEKHKFKVCCNVSLLLSSGVSSDHMSYPRIISVHFS